MDNDRARSTYKAVIKARYVAAAAAAAAAADICDFDYGQKALEILGAHMNTTFDIYASVIFYKVNLYR